MSSGTNKIGTNTHKLIAERLGGEVLLLATGSLEYCLMVYRARLDDINAGRLKLKPLEKFYIAEVMPELVMLGPDFEYEIMGVKL